MGWNKAEAPGIAAKRRRSMVATPEVETSYHAASLMARDTATWSAMRVSPDAALLPEIDVIAARSDELSRNNGIASGAERTTVDNVVGHRVSCKPMPDLALVGREPKWASKWSRLVESQFGTFADTDWFDAGLRHNLHSMTRVIVRSVYSSGEALVLPLYDGYRNGSRWRTNFRLVDPARLGNPLGREDKGRLRGGIEVDENGAAVAYHIRKEHPNDSASLGLAIAGEWERIPAYMPWGRRRVLHIYDPERIGQSRGKSAVASVARQFKMLDHYMREELRLAVLNSLIFMMLETPMDQMGIAEMFGDDPEGDPMGAYYRALGEWRVQMKGGAVVPLPPGTKGAPFAPQRNHSALDSFSTVMVRSIAAGLNMPYELVMKDFSKTNYSSARAALTEAYRYFLSFRQFIIDRWLWPVYDLWFEEAVGRGMLPDVTPEDYYANQVAWTRASWIFPGRGWVDPFKEARAANERMSNGITTYAQECAEQGQDWRVNLETIAMVRDYAAELDVPDPHAPKAKAAPATPQQTADQMREEAELMADDPAEDAAGATGGQGEGE